MNDWNNINKVKRQLVNFERVFVTYTLDERLISLIYRELLKIEWQRTWWEKRQEKFKFKLHKNIFLPSRLAKVKKIGQYILLVKLWGNGLSYNCWREWKLLQTSWRDVWQYPIGLLLGVYLEGTAITIWKYICTNSFIVIARHWKK